MWNNERFNKIIINVTKCDKGYSALLFGDGKVLFNFNIRNTSDKVINKALDYIYKKNMKYNRIDVVRNYI